MTHLLYVALIQDKNKNEFTMRIANIYTRVRVSCLFLENLLQWRKKIRKPKEGSMCANAAKEGGSTLFPFYTFFSFCYSLLSFLI